MTAVQGTRKYSMITRYMFSTDRPDPDALMVIAMPSCSSTTNRIAQMRTCGVGLIFLNESSPVMVVSLAL
ncbi:hypothetical protein D3C81_2062400 [compost metagenome]